MLYLFTLREAQSDVSGAKFLADGGAQAFELDYELAAGAALGVIDQFISSAQFPNLTLWQGGNYTVTIQVVNANSIAFTVAIYRADLNGNVIAELGGQPVTQTAAGASSANPENVQFSIPNVAQLAASATDRLLLKLLAQNTDASNPHEFSIMASASVIQTPLLSEMEPTNKNNPYRRNKSLGFRFRPGEGAMMYDQHGVDIVPNRLP